METFCIVLFFVMPVVGTVIVFNAEKIRSWLGGE